MPYQVVGQLLAVARFEIFNNVFVVGDGTGPFFWAFMTEVAHAPHTRLHDVMHRAALGREVDGFFRARGTEVFSNSNILVYKLRLSTSSIAR